MDLDKPVKQWCEKHWAPIRDSYTEGQFNKAHINQIAAQIYIMTTVMGDKEIQERAGFKEHHKNQADPSVINVLVAEISPVCCWLGDDGMKQLYEDCRNDRKGAPCPQCGVHTFPGGYDRQGKKSIILHKGGAWDCEQYRKMQKR